MEVRWISLTKYLPYSDTPSSLESKRSQYPVSSDKWFTNFMVQTSSYYRLDQHKGHKTKINVQIESQLYYFFSMGK